VHYIYILGGMQHRYIVTDLK